MKAVQLVGVVKRLRCVDQVECRGKGAEEEREKLPVVIDRGRIRRGEWVGEWAQAVVHLTAANLAKSCIIFVSIICNGPSCGNTDVYLGSDVSSRVGCRFPVEVSEGTNMCF